MNNAPKPSLPENFAELVVDDMKIRAQEAGTNLADLLKNSLWWSENVAIQPEYYDPDC